MDNLPIYNDDTQLLGSVATDEIANVHYPRSKLGWGADGSYVDVSAAQPLPVSAVQSGTWNVGAISGVVHVDDNGGSITVDGSVAVTNAGTFAVQVSSALPAGSNVIGGVTQSGSWTVSAIQSGSWSVSISGTPAVDTELPAAAALADGASNPTAPAVGASLLAFNGSTWDRLRGDVSNGLDVDVTRIGGSVTVQQATASSLKTTAELSVSGTAVDDDHPVPVSIIDGTLATAPIEAIQSGTWNIGSVSSVIGVVHIDDNGASITVDGSVSISGTATVSISGTPSVDTELPAAASLADGASNPSTPLVGACLEGFNGTTWDRLRSDTSNGLDVDVTRVQGTVAVTQSGSWSVDVGSALPAGANAIGRVVPEASASGTGTSAYRNAALSNTAQTVKGSAGRLYGVHCYNPNAAEVYLQFYDHASPTVGTTTPTRTYAVPGSGWLTLDLTVPHSYATAIKVAVTTTAGGGTAPGSGLLVDVEYV